MIQVGNATTKFIRINIIQIFHLFLNSLLIGQMSISKWAQTRQNTTNDKKILFNNVPEKGSIFLVIPVYIQILFFHPFVVDSRDNFVILYQKVQPPYGGLLSSSCRGQWPFGPKGDFAGRTDKRTTGLRELDSIHILG